MNNERIIVPTLVGDKIKFETIGIVRGNPFNPNYLTVILGRFYFQLAVKKLKDVIDTHEKFHGIIKHRLGAHTTRDSLYRHTASIFKYVSGSYNASKDEVQDGHKKGKNR